MADPRDTARQWLADTMCADLDIDLDKPSCRRCLEKADAIVNHPDVEVWAEGVAVLDPAATHPYPGVAARQRVVIRLPVEEGTGTC